MSRIHREGVPTSLISTYGAQSKDIVWVCNHDTKVHEFLEEVCTGCWYENFHECIFPPPELSCGKTRYKQRIKVLYGTGMNQWVMYALNFPA